ncbi:hypothetical protein ABPG72_003918 [Tetrahymena utriculariae]
MIPLQAGYQNSPIESQYADGLDQKNLFQSDQKKICTQYNNLHNNNNSNNNQHILNTKIVNDSRVDDISRIRNANQMGISEENSLTYKAAHLLLQPSTDDLFGSESKHIKNQLVQYDTPSDSKYFQSGLQIPNNQYPLGKKLMFLNQQSTPNEHEKNTDTYSTDAKPKQQDKKILEAKETDTQYFSCIPQKELFTNDISECDIKNTASHFTSNLKKEISFNPKSSLIASSQNELQKQHSATVANGADKYQSHQQISQHSSRSNTSNQISKAILGEQHPNQKQLNGAEQANINKQGLKRQTTAGSTATSSSSHHNPYYYNGNGSSNMNYHHSSHSYHNPSLSSLGSTNHRGYGNNNSQQQLYQNSCTTQSNSISSNNNNNSNYTYYPSHPSSEQSMYGTHGPVSHHHMPHIYPQDDMDYGYTDMYGYYYPPFHSMPPIGEGVDSKKYEGEGSEPSEILESDEYKKYYYGQGSSSYAYYSLLPATNAQNNTQTGGVSQTSPLAPSKCEANTSAENAVSMGLSTQNSEYIHQQEKYDHSEYMRGYYDPKGYYPPHSYYYPPMNEMHVGNPYQQTKKNSKKTSSSSNYHPHISQPHYPSAKGHSQAGSFSKYEQGQDMYLHPIDPSYNSYGMHPHHSSGIYCDSQYYTQNQLQSKPSSLNYKKPNHQNQSDKENIHNKSNLSSKENHQLSKEKNDQKNNKENQKILSSNLSNSHNSKKYSQIHEQGDNNDCDQLDNQESSLQNQSTSHEIRKRKRKNNDQLKILKIEYQKGGFWGKEKILEVAQITGLSESQVYKWCWDQKKKRLESFKKKLGTKMIAGQEYQYEDMSGDGMEDDSYKQTGSPEKLLKLNDATGIVAIKTNISKLSNDFTINQLQEKVLANKNRALQNITDKVLSRQNSKQSNQPANIKLEKQLSLKISSQEGTKQNQENINPENTSQQLDDVSKRLQFSSAF